MPKNIVQDVIPRTPKKGIRNVSSSYTRNQEDKRTYATENANEDPEIESRETGRRAGGSEKDKRPRWAMWVVSALSVLVLVFIFGSMLSGATVIITPRSQTVSVDLDLTHNPSRKASN